MEDKKILITGAGSGLGKALSRWLSGLCAQLCLLSQTQEKLSALQAELATPPIAYAVDFAREVDLDRVLTQIAQQAFIPDVIIHCAGGGFKMHEPLLKRNEFERLLSVNLAAVVQINHTFIPKMRARERGVVIHVGSTAAHAAHGSVAYNTAKAALAAYVRSLGRALAATPIVVTGISPGSFIAEGNNLFHFKQEKSQAFSDYAATRPGKRIAEVKEFFRIIQILCEQDSALFSGCMIPIDAGEGMAYTH